MCVSLILRAPLWKAFRTNGQRQTRQNPASHCAWPERFGRSNVEQSMVSRMDMNPSARLSMQEDREPFRKATSPSGRRAITQKSNPKASTTPTERYHFRFQITQTLQSTLSTTAKKCRPNKGSGLFDKQKQLRSPLLVNNHFMFSTSQGASPCKSMDGSQKGVSLPKSNIHQQRVVLFVFCFICRGTNKVTPTCSNMNLLS